MRTATMVLVATLLVGAPAAAEGQAPPPKFTAAQAQEGETAYRSSCASCHGAALEGGADAPPLEGAYFSSSWGGRSVRSLLGFVRDNMPLTRPGSLDEETYLSLVAFLLERNGSMAGTERYAEGDPGVIQGKSPSTVPGSL